MVCTSRRPRRRFVGRRRAGPRDKSQTGGKGGAKICASSATLWATSKGNTSSSLTLIADATCELYRLCLLLRRTQQAEQRFSLDGFGQQLEGVALSTGVPQ